MSSNKEIQQRLAWIDERARDLKTWRKAGDNAWRIGVVWIVAVVVWMLWTSPASSIVAMFATLATVVNSARATTAERRYWQRWSSKPGEPPYEVAS